MSESHTSFNPHGTTILGVRRNGAIALGGDGQVTLGNSVMKGNALPLPAPIPFSPTLGTSAGVNAFNLKQDGIAPYVLAWNIGVQRELPHRFNLDIAYVGSQGRHLLWNQQINQTPAGTLSPTNAARPYRGYGNINLRSTTATSAYNSLQMSLSRPLRAGS